MIRGKKFNSSELAARIAGSGSLMLLCIMPFHAFLAVSLGTRFGNQTLIQSWKELLLITILILTLPKLTMKAIRREQPLWQPINMLIAVFAAIALIVSLVNEVTGSALAFGAKTDFEFLLAFVLAQLAGAQRFESWASRIILAASGVVVAFGAAQVLFLPINFLAQFGYSTATVVPFQFVDGASRAIRILSTLGGPNQLGSFLILPIALIIGKLMKQQWWFSIFFIVALFVLFNTYSRSAWLGTLAAISTVVFLSVPQHMRKILAVILVTVLLPIFALGVHIGLKDPYIKRLIIHGEQQAGTVTGADSDRLNSNLTGLNLVKRSPAGLGLGSAGPASFRTQKPLITENYYIQIAVETGILGLAAFIGICAFLGRELYRRRSNSELAIPLLGALIGISIVNLFLHGWADSSTALVYWTTSGLVIGTTHVTAKKI